MRHTTPKGFTLIEMLSVLAIFAVITSVVIFNYGKFRSDTILVNMAYEVALSIREAQIYGVSSRAGQSNGSPDFTIPYGLFIPAGDSGQYLLFADSDLNGVFSGTSCDTPGGDTCITPYTMQQNVVISQNEILTPSGQTCNSSSNSLSIVFERPNPEPLINNRRTPLLGAQITLTAPDKTARYVVVYINGQVAVVNEDQCKNDK